MSAPKARLCISCEVDRPGIVAAVSGFLHNHGANITHLDQHSTDPEGGHFYMRLEFETPQLNVSRDVLKASFERVVAERFDMEWTLSFSDERPKVAILVSKYDHALLELLWRFSRGEMAGDVTMVISNHPDLEKAVEAFGIPYHHVPMTRATAAESEAKMLELLEGQADLVVLARFMQILSSDFVDKYPSRIINIHHSFLPAFVGANPYRQAHQKGVKLIGATAHYVTADLDQGPIIEQDVARVSHRQDVKDLAKMGANLERQVLSRAVQWHLEDRILLDGAKTVVFGEG